METTDSIYFYSHHDTYKYMSNFYPSEFEELLENGNKIKFNCSEQYLMYSKAKLFEPNNVNLHNEILAQTSPTKIKQLGRNVKNYNDAIWSNMRYFIMLNGLRLKFGQNPQIKELLIQTHPKILYEASKTDKIWGIGFDSQTALNVDKKKYGTNLLGIALMQIRNELING